MLDGALITQTVRQATHADEQHLYDLLVDLHAKNKSGWGIPFDYEVVMAWIEIGTRPTFATRTNPNDRRVGWICVIGPEGGRLLGTVGVFVQPAAWFAHQAVALVELWLYVRPEARGQGYERKLFAFADEKHQAMKGALAKTDYRLPFPLQTGFMHKGERFSTMVELWRRMSRAKMVGVLFTKD